MTHGGYLNPKTKSDKLLLHNKTLHPTDDQLESPTFMTIFTSHKILSTLSGHQSVCFTFY
ncbi:hypothetical protein [Rubritalea tangerina]|uniref:hypothetical protein n=1 Tax=Rubritalea tangerina TaxID=430798 RepID=UPI003622C6B8